ncbi:MAG: type II toxin-antitoxin system Phd/YefM family antitoxin [Gammaproteobacteria bacterium]|jgi:prevent-host-death family protein
MTTFTASKARANLYKLIDETAKSHTPIHITGKRTNVVLIAEEDWENIQETLYLLSIPNMRQSIKKGLNTKLSECSEELDW